MDCTSLISSNPDIDGLGIRLATYLQILIGTFTLAISPENGIDSWWAVIITSLGLQIAAVADHQELSLYHALVVTWMSFPVFIMSFYYGFMAWGKRMRSEIMIGTVLHMTLYPAFCLWVWGSVHSFGPETQCNDQVKFALFAMLRPTGWVRYLVLYIVGIWAFAVSALWISVTSLSIFLLIAKYNPSLRQWWASTPTPTWKHTPSLNMTAAVLTSLNLVSLLLAIIMIERMVKENSDIVEGGSDEWTFGQIIAMILVAAPLLTLVKIVLAEYKTGINTVESLQGRPAASLVAKILGRGIEKHKLDPPVGSSSSSDPEDSPEQAEDEIGKAEEGLLPSGVSTPSDVQKNSDEP
ncbi:hypothetical protein VKT23_006091 [Stygiomarasmius scandens]|uniref:Uncharacterized protein n=1 Tax=Marasmiellus scandens TaxID=2682957 RepID=A0ABR1JSI4_9AGAR